MANFSYCMNVHPASSFKELITNLQTWAYPIAKKVKSIETMGVELHLNHIVAEETLQKIPELKQVLEKLDLKVFSINNYPLIDFHQNIVKDKVYLPNWSQTERLLATNSCATILANLLKKGENASISTLAGAYRYHDTYHQTELICNNYLKACAHILALNQQYNINISLALEPEPDTTLDSLDSILKFFNHDLKQACVTHKLDYKKIKTILGLNLDACHSSVIFEKPSHLLEILHLNDIKIFKFHITNAPILKPPYTSEKIESFKKLNEPKYLHQTFAVKDNQLFKFKDLNEFSFDSCEQYQEIRTHFHVPLNIKEFSHLDTSNQEVIELLKAATKTPCHHNFVTETYTWPQHLAANAINNLNIAEGIAEEVLWLMKTWQSIQKRS